MEDPSPETNRQPINQPYIYHQHRKAGTASTITIQKKKKHAQTQINKNLNIDYFLLLFWFNISTMNVHPSTCTIMSKVNNETSRCLIDQSIDRVHFNASPLTYSCCLFFPLAHRYHPAKTQKKKTCNILFAIARLIK